MSALTLRDALPDEAGAITDLALRSKAHWGYSAAQMADWRAGLTVTVEMIWSSVVRVAVREGRLAGFHVLSSEVSAPLDREGYFEVDFLFVDPDALGAGIGAHLMADLEGHARGRGAAGLVVISDPNAQGFYRRMGFVPHDQAPGSLGGGARLLPRLIRPFT